MLVLLRGGYDDDDVFFSVFGVEEGLFELPVMKLDYRVSVVHEVELRPYDFSLYDLRH